MKNIILRKKVNILSFLVMIAFTALPFVTLFYISTPELRIGEFGVIVHISILGLIAFLLLFSNKRSGCSNKDLHIAFTIFCGFCILSLLNPNNLLRSSIIPPFIFFLQMYLFASVVRRTYKSDEIYIAIYEAISCWVILETILTICFPILGLDSVSTMFKGESAEEWTMRRDGYPSAVGTFAHPGGLAFVISCYILFYLSAFYSGFKKRESCMYIFMGIFTLLFTYSRTSYIALFVSSLVLYMLIRKKTKKLIKRIFSYSLLFFSLILLVSLIPTVRDLFLGSDSAEQVNNRLIHYLIGWDIFINFPILGTGINNHVYYMYNYVDLKFLIGEFRDFFLENPIHNAHLIVLVETGLLGFIIAYYLQIRLMLKMYKEAYADQRIYGGPICTLCILLFCFIYGFFGWSVYNYDIFTPVLLLICFIYNNKHISTANIKKSSTHYMVINHRII